jgi:hypothetical protein
MVVVRWLKARLCIVSASLSASRFIWWFAERRKSLIFKGLLKSSDDFEQACIVGIARNPFLA